MNEDQSRTQRTDEGWAPDPLGRHELRWWQGSEWTGHVSDGERTGYDDTDLGVGRTRAGEPSGDLPSRTSTVPSTSRKASEPAGPIAWALAGAGGALVVGSFLPWATVTVIFGTISVSGTEGDGVFTLILGAVIALVGVLLATGTAPRGLWVLALVLAIVATAIAVIDIATVSSRVAEARDEGVHASVGIGLWLCAAAGVAAVVLSIVTGRRPQSAGGATHA